MRLSPEPIYRWAPLHPVVSLIYLSNRTEKRIRTIQIIHHIIKRLRSDDMKVRLRQCANKLEGSDVYTLRMIESYRTLFAVGLLSQDPL
jgi:hypothetical protein